MVPSFFTPVLMYMRAPARMVVEIVSSALSRTIITGPLGFYRRQETGQENRLDGPAGGDTAALAAETAAQAGGDHAHVIER